MLKLRYLCCLFLVCCNIALKAQERNTIVLHARDAPVLLPVVEKILDTMTFRGKKVFDATTNLNEVFSNIENDKSSAAAFIFLTNKNLRLSKKDMLLYDSLAAEIANYKYFLNIHINKINTMLEIQFYLYKTSNLGVKRRIGPNDLLASAKVSKPEYYTSFIVDLVKNDYNERIYWEVTKMFPYYNELPSAVISSQQQLKKVYDLAVGDTLAFAGDYSTDRETYAKNLNFTWSRKRIDTGVKSPATGRSLVSDRSAFKFIGHEAGRFRVYLSVSDGANVSAEDSVEVRVNYRPKIQVSSTKVVRYTYGTVFPLRNYDPGTFFVKVENFSRPFPTLHIEKDPLDSIRFEEKRKKTLRYRLTSLAFSRLPNLSWINNAKSEPKPYSLDTLSNGYLIKMDRAEAMEDLWASYEVSVSNYNLGSDKVKIVYQNIVYSAPSLYVAYESFSFGRFSLNRFEQKPFTNRRMLRVGIAYNFIAEFSRRRGIYGTFSFGSTKANLVEGMDVDAPLETTLYFKLANFFPVVFGAYGRLVNVRTVYIEIPKYIEVKDNYRLIAGGILGFYLHPSKKLPLAIVATAGVQFSPIRVNGLEIGYGFSNIGLKYFFRG